MGIPAPLWKVTLHYISLQKCCVQCWMIRWLVLSHSKVVLHERCMYDFWRRNCSNFRRMCLWISEVVCTSNLTEKLVIFVWSWNFRNDPFPGRWSGARCLHKWSEGSWIIVCGDGGKQRFVAWRSSGKCIARLQFGCGLRRIMNSQQKLQQHRALFTTDRRCALQLRVRFSN